MSFNFLSLERGKKVRKMYRESHMVEREVGGKGNHHHSIRRRSHDLCLEIKFSLHYYLPPHHPLFHIYIYNSSLALTNVFDFDMTLLHLGEICNLKFLFKTILTLKVFIYDKILDSWRTATPAYEWCSRRLDEPFCMYIKLKRFQIIVHLLPHVTRSPL